MSLKNDLASVLADAQWLPSHWDGVRDAVQFAWIPRETHRKLTFLADEYLQDIEVPLVWTGMDDLRAVGACASAPHYIFHSAFCCSTLLARALDVPGVSMGLNEPQILNEMAGALRAQRLGPDVLQTITRLLGRPFGPAEMSVIKPSNEANVLANTLLASDAGSRAIFLYAPLPRFLASVARKGMWGRIWGRRLYSLLRRDNRLNVGLSDEESLALSDLQVSGLAWLLHRAEAAALLAAFPDRVRTLDSETFLAHRADSLFAVGHHFGLNLDKERAEQISNGPVFRADSKKVGRNFDGAPGLSTASDPTIKEEIAMVGTWIRAVADHAGLAIEMPAESALIAQL